MNHEREFSNSEDDSQQAAHEALKRETAAAYARCFVSPDGQRVLEDLRRKFSHERSRFSLHLPNQSAVTAAIIDGQCSVLREIEQAVKAGSSAGF